MRAGRLDKFITIQRKTETQSMSGEPTEAWTTIIQRRSAGVWVPAQGSEAFTAPQLVARERVEWLIRVSDDVDDLSPLDRVVYPAIEADEVSDDRTIYDIVSVHEDRKDGLRLVTARRPDVT